MFEKFGVGILGQKREKENKIIPKIVTTMPSKQCQGQVTHQNNCNIIIECIQTMLFSLDLPKWLALSLGMTNTGVVKFIYLVFYRIFWCFENKCSSS